MNVVALLIFWTAPLLPAAGLAQSPPVSFSLSVGITAGADLRVTSSLIQGPIQAVFPSDSSKFNLGAPYWLEEDSLDDPLVDSGLFCPRWRVAGRKNFSWFAHPQRDLLRSPSNPLPLRC